MRIDHHAYQRGIRVAGVGFMIQSIIGLTLLIFSIVRDGPGIADSALLFGAIYILLGLLPWVGLLVLFNQHKLERLEALEQDDLVQSRSVDNVFDDDDELRVAARRLGQIYTWFLPILSLVLAASLAGAAWLMLREMSLVSDEEAVFAMTPNLGWAVAICLAFSASAFIFSRFVAGMAKLEAWQNLRGGAAYMVGIALVTLAVAVGIGFRFFDNDVVLEKMGYAIPIFMILIAVEIVLNFVLNLYRPRVAGEHPRPAFDSKLLSLLAAPDNLVRSLNEAVNYQFGFDITSSWGYQLLLRSFLWLLGAGLAVLVLLNMIVIVEPNEQAVKLSRGTIVDDTVHGSGVMFKLPWPLQTAERYSVTRVRDIHLTSRDVANKTVHLWADSLGQRFDVELDPFIVGVSADDVAAIEDRLSLVDAEMILRYRIKSDGGLIDWLRFSDQPVSRTDRTEREQALRHLALREVVQTLATRPLDDVLASGRAVLAGTLRDRIQAACDAARTGVDVIAIDIPMLQPIEDVAKNYANLARANEARRQEVARAEQMVVAGLAQLVGDASMVDTVAARIDEFQKLQETLPPKDDALIVLRQEIAAMLDEAGGAAADIIARAERDRWVRLIEARTDASRLVGQIRSYRAAPTLYRERAKMRVLGNALFMRHKYVFGVDPSRFDIRLDLTELNSQFNVADGILQEEELPAGASQP